MMDVDRMSLVSRIVPVVFLAGGALPVAFGAETGAKETVKLTQEPVEEAAVRPALTRKWNVTLQTGLAEMFQLTLGGVFGDGPAWQNRMVITRSHVFRDGDSVSITGFNTHDTPTHSNDWTAGIGYRTRLVNKRGHLVYAGGGLERWRFPSVLCGTQDWILASNAMYATKLKRIPVTVQSNAWTILHSPLPGGSLLYTTAWFDHSLMENRQFKVLVRHGPQYTYSWNFYGTNGHRVVRYAGALVVTHGRNTYEAGIRPQYGLKRYIPDNKYWNVMVSRTF
jgi:hypothetical protein